MSAVLFTTGRQPTEEQLVALYDSVGWAAYTQHPDRLYQGVKNSLRVATAWTQEGQLVGLARVVGDGQTIAYLQDVLVHPDWQRTGVGRWLVREVFAPFSHVRQQVLMTDDEPRQLAFYESVGFKEIREVGDGSSRAFLRHGVDYQS